MRYDGFDYQDEFQDEFDRLFEDFTQKQWEWETSHRCPECDAFTVEGLCEECDILDEYDETGEVSFNEFY